MTDREKRVWRIIAEATQNRVTRALYYQMAKGKKLLAVINMSN